jgi:hypothetical protein
MDESKICEYGTGFFSFNPGIVLASILRLR